MVPPLLTVKQAADLLTVSADTVRRWADNGTLEAVKMGGSRRIRRDSVERAIAGAVGEDAARVFEPLVLAGDPVALMTARIGLSPRGAALRPDLLEGRDVVPPGEHLERFARAHCRYIELGEVGEDGPKLGDPYELEAFEREFFDEALSCDDDGRRFYSRDGLVIPRKNRKTTSCSLLSLYMASPADAEHRPRVVQAAGSKSQAAKLYETTRGFIDDPSYGSEALHELFVPHETRIDCPSIAGKIFRVAGDGDLNHSLDPHVVAADELHTWKTPKQRENWRALTTAQGGRLDPLVVFISTEGEGDDNELADVLARLEASASTDIEHRRPGLTIYRNRPAGTLVYKYAISDTSTIADMPAFLAANPAPWRTADRIAADLADTFNDEPTKLRLYGNRRAASSSARRWIKPDLWEDARDPDTSPADEDWIPHGVVVAAGGDAAITHDTSAVGWAWRDPEGHVRIRSRVWSVRQGIAFHEFVEGGRLDNEDHLEPYVSDVLARRYTVGIFGYDPRYLETEAKHLSEAGLTVVDVTPSSATMGDAIQAFWAGLVEGKIRHDGDQVLAAHVANTAGRRIPRGHGEVWKLSSISNALPKDALVAVVLAYYLIDHAPPPRSRWLPFVLDEQGKAIPLPSDWKERGLR
jgi:excisionase family DNA binding protein